MKGIFGTKIGMTSIFDTEGKVLPVSVVYCEPNTVIENKNTNKYGHICLKVGFGEAKEKNKSKSHNGIFKKQNLPINKFIRTITNGENLRVGDKITVDTFTVGDWIDAQGTSRGRGYTGPIARWNFKIGPLSHGHGYPHRWQGSIAFGRGGSQGQRVPKGKKMAGQYGNETVSVQNLPIVQILKEQNLILILGAIPGPAGAIVRILQSVKKPNANSKFNIVTKEVQKQIQEQNVSLEDKDALHIVNEQIDKDNKEGGDKK